MRTCCLYRLMFVERPGVCVLASAMGDWLLRRVGRFALCSLEHRGVVSSGLFTEMFTIDHILPIFLRE
jgi:hypothetical protein